MRKRGRALLASISLAISALLAGCTLPQFPDERFISVNEVVDRVQCELRRAVDANPRFKFSEWVGAFGLTLKVETNVGADASVDWVIPFHAATTFKFGPTVGVNNFIRREGNLKFDINFDKPLKEKCNKELGIYRAYGDFGLQGWIEKVANATGTDDATSPKSFDYTLEFAVKLNGKGTPGFTIINLSGTAGLSSDRTDNHTLSVAFTKVGGDPTPQWVCVENLPGAERCRPKGAKALGSQVGSAGSRPGARQQLYQQLDMLRPREQLRR